MKYYLGLEKFQSQQVMYEILGKQSIFFKKAEKYSYSRVIFRNAENFIDIGECTKTLSVKCANVTIPAKGPGNLRRVSCGYAERSPYILCCDWNFPPGKTWQETGLDVYMV